MKFTLSLYFLAAFSAAPATVHGAHHHLRRDRVAGETNEKRIDRHARPVSDEKYGSRSMRESERQILVTSDRRSSSRAHEDREFNTLIVGGNAAGVGEYPYFVGWGCGGSLIAPDLVLTAAHCGGKPDDVIVGGYKPDSTSNGGVRVKVTNAVKHPNYNDNSVEYDFMLFKLETPVTDKEVVLLNFEDNSPSNGQTLTVIGLGALNEDGDGPSKLQEVDVKYITNDDCNEPDAYNGQISSSMFCAGVSGGGKDSCQGDSGGPIVIKKSGQDVQVGVVSWGDGCGRPGKPGVYARVSVAEDWIKSEGCQLSSANPVFCDGPSPVPAPVPAPVLAPVPAPVPAPSDSECAKVIVRFQGDEWSSDDNNFYLENLQTGDYIWDESQFDSNELVRRTACIDRNGCHKFDFWDNEGDGLVSPGLLTLKYDGKTIYKGRDLGNGIEAYIGDGCE